MLHEDQGKVIEVVRPSGNLWPRLGAAPEPWNEQWLAFQHQVNAETERHMLFSIARRLATGKPINRISKVRG